ncbi:TauD/TfdA family dioxygenase [Sphingobium sufflavum]|uniref:TauD/TfdA dioxygenase family protein n=1 Tax=Sphingobium sufflavum TaxID=1129547 RepID=UPI001F32F87C|nr:TauD/TfdA family dioxygenase [Sphingobium sufflavum]MCE7795244.1 TauD/TfdA family dioxygenase [Sphingobium sufflavum]
MSGLSVTPLQDDLPFGVRIAGLTLPLLEQEGVRARINALFEEKGLIVFADVEPSSHMHVAISNVFGPLKEHPNPAVTRVEGEGMPGVIDMRHVPGEGGVVEINGQRLSMWLPWHFDHCYNDELNRAGVLRAIEVAPEGGLTGFADGIDLYRSLSPDLRDRIEGRDILYTMNLNYRNMRFGKPEGLVEITPKPGAEAVEEAARQHPRALHPAIWTRATGEKVLHVSPWMAAGIKGEETAEGDALLEAVCREIGAKARAYFHQWNLTDMLIWDNWRMLHSVTGMAPEHGRRMQRTTIRGDYGLGRFEDGGTGGRILEMTV